VIENTKTDEVAEKAGEEDAGELAVNNRRQDEKSEMLRK
jgi:hypothetical protein